jgi:hypothetical protein
MLGANMVLKLLSQIFSDPTSKKVVADASRPAAPTDCSDHRDTWQSDSTYTNIPTDVVIGDANDAAASLRAGLRQRARGKTEVAAHTPPPRDCVEARRKELAGPLKKAIEASCSRLPEAPILWTELHDQCLLAGIDFRELCGPQQSDAQTPIETVLNAHDWETAKVLFKLLPNGPLASGRVLRLENSLTMISSGKRYGPGISFMPRGYYEGNFHDGQWSGPGHYVGHNGTTYKGMFENSLMHGYGHLQSAAGFTYKGMFKNNFKHGHGHFQTTSGFIYEGIFDNNKYYPSENDSESE